MGRSRSRRHDIVKPSKYKTSVCSFFSSPEGCPFGGECAFAHGDHELRSEPKTASGTPEAAASAATQSHPDNGDTATALSAAAPPALPSKSGGAAGGGDAAGGSNGAALHKQQQQQRVPGAARNANTSAGDGRDRDRDSKPQARSRTRLTQTAAAVHHHQQQQQHMQQQHIQQQQRQFQSQIAAAMGSLGAAMGGPFAPPVSPPVCPSAGNGHSVAAAGFQSLAEMPYSSNTAIPNAPLYIPTNLAQHPYFSINNSNRFLNVGLDMAMMGRGDGTSPQQGPVMGMTQGGATPPPLFMFGGAGGVAGLPPPPPPSQQQQQLQRQASFQTSPQPQGHKPTGGVPPHHPSGPSARGHGNVVSSNTLANAGHSRGGRALVQQLAPQQQQQQQRMPSGMNAPALQALLDSAAPPTVVHVPFGGSDMAWPGGGGGYLGSPAHLGSLLQQQGGGYYAYALPNAYGLPILPGDQQHHHQQQQQQPEQQQSAASLSPPALSLENLLASIGQQERRGTRRRGGPLGGPSSGPEDEEDDDAASEATDWSAFLESVLRPKAGGPSLTGSLAVGSASPLPTVRPPPSGRPASPSPPPVTGAVEARAVAAAPAAAPARKASPQLAPSPPALPVVTTSIAASLPSLLRPLALTAPATPPTHPAPAAAIPTPVSVTVRVATAKVPKPRPKRAMLCAVSRAGNAPAVSGDSAARHRRGPVMLNQFKSSCSAKEPGGQAQGKASLLLYSAEKNTLYYITAPAAARRKQQLQQQQQEAEGMGGPVGNAADGVSGHAEGPGAQSDPAAPPPGVSSSAGAAAATGGPVRSGGAVPSALQGILGAKGGIRCNPPKRRYQRMMDSDSDDDGIEYCI